MAQNYFNKEGFTSKQYDVKDKLHDALGKFKWVSMTILFMHLMFIMLSIFNMANAQTYAPRNYWTFNGTPANKDSMNNFNLDFASYLCQYTITSNGAVGKGISLNSTGDNINAGVFAPDTAFTIEFLFKPGYLFNATQIFRRLDGSISAGISLTGLSFSTYTNGTGNDELSITFDELDRASYGYYIDGNWHHLVFKYSANTGEKAIYVDGICPPGFSKTISGKLVNGGNTSLFFNQGVSYYKYNGEYDEIALYYTSLPKELVYKHYINFKQQGVGYSFVNNYSQSIPTAPALTGPLDMTEFAPGHPSANVSALDQLKSYPTPRYKSGNTLLKNFNWVDLMYMGGRFQSGVSDAQSVTTSTALNEELAKNWNYMIQLKISMDAWGTSWANLANQNPQLGTSIITLRAQLYPSNITSQNLTSDKYFQNSSGTFLDPNGNSSSHKWWRPTASPSVYENDGTQQRANLQTVINALTRPITMINENGEVFPWITDNALAMDPQVVAAKTASGLDYQTFQGRKFKENETQSYRDMFMTLPALANTKFTEYGIDGFAQYRQKYSEARQVNSQINGQYYSTPDFYPRWPYNWRNWVGAWHGWQWIVDSRYNELQAGDNLFSPFLAAGWDVNEENNIRPAQFLGLVKCLSMIGAEFFYTGYFNEAGNYSPPNPPPGNPANYAWQTAIPSYAQAVSSRYEELLRHGQVMNGDVPAYISVTNKPGYTFWAGDLRKLVVIRKHNTLQQYAITGTIQPPTSMVGGAENESVATITLDGQQLKFKVRRQGSTYIYDKTNASSPVFYQLDEWHEKTHPSYWSKDFTIEAELNDNTNATYNLKTTVPAGTTAGDYTNSTTSIVFPSTQTTFTPIEFNIQPRSASQSDLFIWVRARSTDGTATGVSISVDNGAAKTIGCVTDTNWAWYRYDACNQQAIEFSGLSIANHVFRFTPSNNKLMFDKFVLSSNSSFIGNAAPAGCSSGSTASVTASGATAFCQGNNVTLTASAGTSYLWSNGATTQAITVNQSGNYSVSVFQAGGCAAVSSPVNVTVSPLPTATITASGPTSFCQGGSVTLTATAGSAYLWSNGATTQSINVTSAGNYTVKVTNAQGCEATSAATAISITNSTSATITAGGATTFCTGGSVVLTASAGTSYLWSNGATTNAITVNASGSYSVTVSNGSCSATSAATTVTVGSAPAATITANGATTFCQGGSVTLTASTGTSYAWSNGATTKSITVNASGSYSVTVSNGSCSATSSATSVTVNNSVTASITAGGPTSFCQGGSVTLTASNGSSYLWSNGATTKTITVTTTGQYSVTVTSGSCSATSATTAVTVNNVVTPTITAGGATTFCQGGSVILTASAGSSYLWSTGATTASITVSSAGQYSVTVSNGSCSGTSAATTVTVGSSTTASITASGATTFCQGGSVTLTASAGTSYLWSTGATTQSITPSSAGSYSVTVSNGSCSATSPSTVVVVNTIPTASITAGGPIAFCQGGSVTLTASNGTSYLWSNGATTKSISASNAGGYSVTVSNGNCSATSPLTTVSVSALPTATITAGSATTFCQGGSVTLTASQGLYYTWSNGATTQSITTSNAGSYSVTVSNGICSATTGTTTVNVNALPNPTITASGSTNLTQGQSVTLTASAGSSYVWSNGANTQSITVSAAGSYYVKVTNSSGCIGVSASMAVTVSSSTSPASITSSSATNSLCSGSSVTLTASPGTSYVWLPTLQATASITVSAPGTYTVNVLNSNGTSSSATVTITQAPTPAAPQISYSYVPASAYVLNAFEGSAVSYSWSTGQSTSSIQVNNPGVYSARAINAYGCISIPTAIKVNSLQVQSCVKPDMLTAYNILNNQAVLSWNPACTADSFLVSYAIKNSGNFRRVYVKSINYLLVKELAAASIYEWSVTAICANGQYKSDNTSFATLSGPTGCGSTVLNTQTNNVTNSTAQLSWFGTTASTVTVRYKKVGAASYSYQTISVGSSAAWGYNLTGLAASTTYQWAAKTICGGVSSSYSTDINFTTKSSCPDLGTPVVVNVKSSSAEIKWIPDALVNSVTIRYAPQGSTSYQYAYASGKAGTITLKNLTSATKYNVWFRSVCNLSSISSWGTPASFNTTYLRLGDEDEANLQLNAYPNPASDKITYAFLAAKSGDYTVKVCDMTGRELIQELRQTEEGPTSGEIKLTNYSTGMYILIVKQAGQQSFLRFQVSK